MTDLVTLTAGPLRLVINPRVGGSILAFEWMDGAGSRPILRKAPGREQVLDAACFPLVPYVNRIRDGAFHFRGRLVRLRPNMAGDPSPLHGQGWLGEWQVETATDREAVIVYHHEAGEWPWAYRARQAFALDDDGLTVKLSCHNLSPEPMPCGLGQHPYFPCTSATVLDTQVAIAWTVDEQVLPVEQVAAKGRYDLHGRRICGQDLDNGFGAWSGEARISDPCWPYALRMSSATARFFQVYSPAAGGIFVAEPVSHANAALNAPEDQWDELGMRVLDQGETMHLDMRIGVERG